VCVCSVFVCVMLVYVVGVCGVWCGLNVVRVCGVFGV